METKTKTPKKHKIIILPEDVEGASYVNAGDCALARAVRREFGLPQGDVMVNCFRVTTYHGFRDKKEYKIEGLFDCGDFEFLQEIKEPYPVVLIED